MSIEPYKFCSCCPLLASPKSMKPLLQLAGTWGKYKSAKYLAFQGKRQMAMVCPTLEMEFLFNTSCGRFDCLGWNTSTWISDQIWSVWWSANKTKLLWVAATIPHIYPIFSTISPDFSTKRIPLTPPIDAFILRLRIRSFFVALRLVTLNLCTSFQQAGCSAPIKEELWGHSGRIGGYPKTL